MAVVGCSRVVAIASVEGGAIAAPDAAVEPRAGPAFVAPLAGDVRAEAGGVADVVSRRSHANAPGSGEARRSILAALEAETLLRPQLASLRAHFGPAARGPYAMQRIDLAGGRTAVLLTKLDETEPIVLALDRDQLVWSRARPTAGIAPPLVHLALAPRPDGGVALFGYVPSMRLVASRMWADDGNPFADLQVFSPSACDALSAAYAPEQGWWVACSSGAGVRAQRVREDGTIAWSEGGVPFGTPSATGPATIVFDTPSTVLMLQLARGVGGDHLLASRYDADGRPLWAAPVDAGQIRARAPSHGSAAVEERLDAARAREGVVRVELPRGLEGKRGQAADIASAGTIRLVN